MDTNNDILRVLLHGEKSAGQAGKAAGQSAKPAKHQHGQVGKPPV